MTAAIKFFNQVHTLWVLNDLNDINIILMRGCCAVHFLNTFPHTIFFCNSFCFVLFCATLGVAHLSHLAPDLKPALKHETNPSSPYGSPYKYHATKLVSLSPHNTPPPNIEKVECQKKEMYMKLVVQKEVRINPGGALGVLNWGFGCLVGGFRLGLCEFKGDLIVVVGLVKGWEGIGVGLWGREGFEGLAMWGLLFVW